MSIFLTLCAPEVFAWLAKGSGKGQEFPFLKHLGPAISEPLLGALCLR